MKPIARVLAWAPSNIALVKYMGKFPDGLPANPSVSMTLDSNRTWFEASLHPGGSGVAWASEPSGLPGFAPVLSGAARAKALEFAEKALPRIREFLTSEGISAVGPEGRIEIQSTSSFPTGCGIASSASSFAALTLALAGLVGGELFRRRYPDDGKLRRSLASVSRAGSGSSIRSFEGPWVAWEGERAWRIPESALPRMAHFVLLFSRDEKKVSSSEAHRRVTGSPLWQGRAGRANERFMTSLRLIARGDLSALAVLAWEEMWEMHSLFHTSRPPFSYLSPRTVELLAWVEGEIGSADSPVVTLDAGPNPHLIVPESKRDGWRARLSERFPSIEILSDRQGDGARLAEIQAP